VLCGCDSASFGLRERTFLILENRMLRKCVILRRAKQVDNIHNVIVQEVTNVTCRLQDLHPL
jgi:hypothetical protein